jgi:phosphoribosylanthranilate isomerase
MVRIKICGITNLEDARAAIAAGADMLGFNFYRPSPRFIDPEHVRAIIESVQKEMQSSERELTTVGVFVNEPSPSALLETADKAGVDAFQLHGDESADFCRNLKTLAPDRFMIKVIRVTGEFKPEAANDYSADAVMLDAFDRKLYGGTGRIVDWASARRVRDRVARLFLAGGLSPSNVAAAITEVRPYAVDACSAIESSPGIKDIDRMNAFVRAARDA